MYYAFVVCSLLSIYWLIVGKQNEEKKANIALGIHNLFLSVGCRIIIKRGVGNGDIKSSMYVTIQEFADPSDARIYNECAPSTWTYC